MNLRQRRRLLLAANVALAAGIVACAAAAVLVPLEGADAGAQGTVGRVAAPSTQPARQARPLAEYAVIWRTNLSGPLFDAPPPPPKPPEPVRLPITLAGTATEEGQAFAFFRTADGRIKTVAVGQTIEGAELLEVQRGSAKLRVGGRIVTLEMPKDGPATARRVAVPGEGRR